MKELITSLTLGALAATTNGATVSVTYGFDAGAIVPTTIIGDISGGDALFSGFIGGTSVPGISATSEAGFVRVSATGATTPDGDELSEAITNDAYLTITITAGANDVTLSTVSWDTYGTSTHAAAAYDITAMHTSAGFTVGNEVGSTSTTSANEGLANTQNSGNIALSGTILAGQSEEFRFYFTDNASTNSRINRIDNIVVTGTTIPEPSVVLLGGFGLLTLVRRKR